MELKSLISIELQTFFFSFNRTNMELKLYTWAGLLSTTTSFNRTNMELKYIVL